MTVCPRRHIAASSAAIKSSSKKHIPEFPCVPTRNRTRNLTCYSCNAGNNHMDKGEWYFEVGYVELLYAAMVVGIAVALYYFRRLKQVSKLAENLIEENSL